MALLKKFQYPNGTETNYHKLGEIRIVPIADKVTYIEVPVEEPEVPVVPEAPVEATEPTEVVETVAEEPTEPTEVTEPEIPGEEEIKPEYPAVEYVPVYTKQYSIMVQILSYVSQEIRETGAKNHLSSQLNYFTVDVNTLVEKDIMALCYELVKTLPEFADAENI